MSRETDGIVVPRMIAEFLDERGCVGCACTRDDSLRPRIHYLAGWATARGGRELLCLVARGFDDGLPAALEAHGELAVTIEHIGPHETYQFKGIYAGSRALVPEDLALWERQRARFAASVPAVDPCIGLPDRALRDYIPAPALAVRMALREIFLQTPGPGAGRRLVPPQDP